jgi:putative SOS response-associated peptidase YedK
LATVHTWLTSPFVCGRVVTIWSAPRLAEYFAADSDPSWSTVIDTPRFNVAPTSLLWTVVSEVEDHRRLVPARWGLIPRWAKDTSGASQLINARAEGLFERPTFRPLVARHRCLVPVGGFYEWGPDRKPRYLHDGEDLPLELAGLWTTWRSGEGLEVRSCTVLTTESTAALAQLHHRMPVALDPDDRERWLEPEPLHPDEIASVVARARTRSSARWQWHEVSKAVNKVGVDHSGLIEPVAPAPTQGQLFGDS